MSYRGRWPKISRAVIAASPVCSNCGARKGDPYVTSKGVTRPVRLTADHIRPASAGGRATRSNLRVLCESCHGERTASNWRRRA